MGVAVDEKEVRQRTPRAILCAAMYIWGWGKPASSKILLILKFLINSALETPYLRLGCKIVAGQELALLLLKGLSTASQAHDRHTMVSREAQDTHTHTAMVSRFILSNCDGGHAR